MSAIIAHPVEGVCWRCTSATRVMHMQSGDDNFRLCQRGMVTMIVWGFQDIDAPAEQDCFGLEREIYELVKGL